MKKMVLFFWLALGLVLLACSQSNTAGTSEESEGPVAIKDREIAGVTQKGPFLMGSSVTIQELDGQTLVQTGKSFKAFVKSNQGDFTIKGVSLVSQYALLEVEGYFRNEITGKNSDGMIQLNALTDLRKRDHVNVNLLTHLESGRILNLVQKYGLSVDVAKKQAEQELFSSFGFMSGIAAPEDMDLFSNKDDGAMLLAVSVLMLQDSSSEAVFSERMSMAAFAFAENGFLPKSDGAKLADWAMLSEIADGSDLSLLQNVRKNLESWNKEVPPFEAYINLFWSNEYGLGVCSDENFHEVRPNLNENSLYYLDEFVCNSNHRWSLIAYRENAGDINIAGVTWAAKNVSCENLNFETFRGFYVPEVVLMGKKQCIAYGAYFSADEASKACPEGYRLPTLEEVQALVDYYGGSENAAVGLRSVDGFAAVMGGYVDPRYIQPSFSGVHETALFWTSTTKTGPDSIFNVTITERYFFMVDPNGVSIGSSNFRDRSPGGISVRCVKEYSG